MLKLGYDFLCSLERKKGVQKEMSKNRHSHVCLVFYQQLLLSILSQFL